MATNFDWGKSYPGARWVRVDLHLHSPGVDSFRFPDGLDHRNRDEILKRYVDQLKAKGIEIAAITDYQQIRAQWFEQIREAALQEGIYVYPGVELSFGGGAGGKEGLHVLAIFPFDANVDDINHAIRALDKQPSASLIMDDNGQHRDLEPRETLSECLQRLRQETGCLLIFPHPNDTKGLLRSFGPKEAAKLLADVRPEAIEDFGNTDRERLQNTGQVSLEDLTRIASVRFSDNHRIEEIGTKPGADGTPRATYLKLSVLNDLRAIRLALLDHEILVSLGEKPESAHTQIERIEVDGGGFLGSMSLALSPELNVLIGGRGVGKSALLEVIRYGLNLLDYSPTEYREGLVKHALGSGGKVTVYLRHVVKPGVERRYRIERVWGEDARVYELDASGERRVELPVTDLVSDEGKPLFFGQRVLYEVAQSPKLRRQFLDDLVGREARYKEREIERLQQELRRNARRLFELREKKARREEVEQRLREIEHEIRLFEQHGLAEKLREETALARDEERLKRVEAIPMEFGQEWEEMRARWQERLRRALADLSQAESQTQTLLRQDAAKVISDLQANLESIFRQGAALLRKAEEELRGVRRRWEEGRRALDEELRRIRQELGRETLDPDRLVQLTSEKENLEYELKMLKQAEAEAQNLERERRELLQKLRDVRLEAFRLREKRAQAINDRIGQRVKVEVLYREQRQEYAQRLVEFFSGSRVARKDLEGIATHEDIADGWALAELARNGKEALMKKTGLSEAQAQRLIDFLTQDEKRLYELELLSPEDEVQVSLKVEDRWIPLEKLSAGQRATAMLLILLTQTQHILIIDQPEDDLDNRFVYEDVVKLLRDQKGERQIIVATHNPNIPVLGHGELVIALEAESEHARIQVQGGMDKREVQDEVRRVMEGGDEAFRRRAEKYGWA